MNRIVGLICVILLNGTSMAVAQKSTLTKTERIGAFVKGIACASFVGTQAYYASTDAKELVIGIVESISNGRGRELTPKNALILIGLSAVYVGLAWTGVQAAQISYDSFKKALSSEKSEELIQGAPVVVRKK